MYSRQDLRDLIKRGLNQNLSIIPTHDKIPQILSWKKYMDTLATPEEVDTWIIGDGVALVAGPVSGGIVCLDVDEKNDEHHQTLNNLKELIIEQDAFLWRKLAVASTPSGGYHVIFKTDFKIPNAKMASREVGGKSVCLIETRGYGGYFCIEPTLGYKFIWNKITGLEVLSRDEAKLIFECAKSLNEIPEEEHHAPKAQGFEGKTPIDDFNERATNESIAEILQRHNWKIVSRRGKGLKVRRPEKQKGISGTVGHLDRRFYCFSTSAAPFDAPRSYSAAAVLCLLEYSGDFTALAKSLYGQGFGDRIKRKDDPSPTNDHVVPPRKLTTVRTSEVLERLMHVYVNGFPSGQSLGWWQMDDFLTIAPSTLNIVTGMPTHGKTEFMDQIMINMATEIGWKWFVYSPENYPFEAHWRKIIEKFVKKPMFGNGRMTENDVKIGSQFIESRFQFFEPGLDGATLYDILGNIKESNIKPNGWVIDPWNDLDMNLSPGMTEEHYTKVALREARKFSRRENMAGFIVAHPAKMYPDSKTGKYQVPTLYSISGSAHFYNKADNGIVVYRDDESGIVSVYIQKVKFRWHGKKGQVDFTYDKFNGRYEISI